MGGMEKRLKRKGSEGGTGRDRGLATEKKSCSVKV